MLIFSLILCNSIKQSIPFSFIYHLVSDCVNTFVTFHLYYKQNEVLCLTMTKEINYKIFSKAADQTVERVRRTEKLKNAESPKSCEQTLKM